MRFYFASIYPQKSVYCGQEKTMEQPASHLPAHIRRGEWNLRTSTNIVLEREHFLLRHIEKQYVLTDISATDR